MRQILSLGLCFLMISVVNAYAQKHEPDSIVPLVAEAVTESSSGSSAITPQKATDELVMDTLDGLQNRANNGDVEAQLNLGYMYLYGVNGTTIDYQQALRYYTMAAEQDSAVAYNNLGSLYFSGIGTDVNREKALNYFQKAAELGSHDAAVNLAIIYLEEANPKSENYKKILPLLTEAQKDNSIAKYLLGYSYLTGFMVEQDYKKAFRLIKAAADENYDEAQFLVANCYIKGYGAPKNYSKAVEYLQFATKQGNNDAILRLADILAEGKIYTLDIKQAHILYNVAAISGFKDAAEKRDALEKNLSIEDLLAVQSAADDFKPEPSEKTTFIRQTFGYSLKNYIDINLNKLKDNINLNSAEREKTN